MDDGNVNVREHHPHHREHHREHHPHHREHHREMGCVDNECHKSMMGMFGNMFKNLPSADKLPHITHTLQITPKKTQSVSTAASIAASQHGSNIAPAQSRPASVPPSSSPLKSITTAAECTAAGGVGFGECDGNYYCCGVDPSKGYEPCNGSKTCATNSYYNHCLCPSNLSSTPASVPPSASPSAASAASAPPSASPSVANTPSSAAPVTKSSSATTNKKKCISSGWVSSSLENIDKSSSYKPTKCPTNYLFNYSNPNVQYVYDSTNGCLGNVSIYDNNKNFLGCACIPSSDCE